MPARLAHCGSRRVEGRGGTWRRRGSTRRLSSLCARARERAVRRARTRGDGGRWTVRRQRHGAPRPAAGPIGRGRLLRGRAGLSAMAWVPCPEPASSTRSGPPARGRSATSWRCTSSWRTASRTSPRPDNHASAAAPNLSSLLIGLTVGDEDATALPKWQPTATTDKGSALALFGQEVARARIPRKKRRPTYTGGCRARRGSGLGSSTSLRRTPSRRVAEFTPAELALAT